MFTNTGRKACATLLVLIPMYAAAQATPHLPDGHPDLNGVWNGNANGPFVKSEDPLAQNLASRDGTLLNFERDNAIIRCANSCPAPPNWHIQLPPGTSVR